MNGSAQSEETTAAAEVAELRERVRALEIRLDQIERAGGVAVPQAQRDFQAAVRPASAAIDTEIAAMISRGRGQAVENVSPTSGRFPVPPSSADRVI